MELTTTGFRFVLGFVFLLASIPKLAAPADFALAVANYRLLPQRLVRPVARALPPLELLCGLALLVGLALPLMGLVAALLLLAFAASVALNLARGRSIDCGCSGKAAPQQITWTLVARDLVLAGLAFTIAAAPPHALAIPIPWPLAAAGRATASDATGVLLAAAIAVLLGSLAEEALRLRALVLRMAAALPAARQASA